MISKQMKKKYLAGFIAIVMALSLLPAASFATDYDDIKGHWAQSRIQSWLEQDLAYGYPDNTFRPDNKVTRAEFVSFMNRAFGVPQTLQTPGFADVDEEDWYYENVSAAVQEGLITGYPDNTFRPDHPITREEAAVIVNRLINLEDLDPVGAFVDEGDISNWAARAVDAVSAAEIMTGYPDKTFRPGNPITRAETVSTLDRALEFEFVPGVVSIAVVAEAVSIEVGEITSIEYEVEPEDAALTFESDDISVATVDADGIVIAVGEGSTTINLIGSYPNYKDGIATIVVTVVNDKNNHEDNDKDNDKEKDNDNHVPDNYLADVTAQAKEFQGFWYYDVEGKNVFGRAMRVIVAIGETEVIRLVNAEESFHIEIASITEYDTATVTAYDVDDNALQTVTVNIVN